MQLTSISKQLLWNKIEKLAEGKVLLIKSSFVHKMKFVKIMQFQIKTEMKTKIRLKTSFMLFYRFSIYNEQVIAKHFPL